MGMLKPLGIEKGKPFMLRRSTVPLVRGAMLLACGIGIYLWIPAVSGRYTIPAVWGADLWIAALLSALAAAPPSAWRRTAYALLGVGLIAVAAENLGSQDKFAARANLLWQAVEFVEGTASHGDTIAWMGGPDLNVEEGIHFSWHLRGRGREDLSVQLLDTEGRTVSRPEVQLSTHSPSFLITGAAAPRPGMEWHLLRRFTASYWGGWRTHSCNVWGRSLSENLPDDRLGKYGTQDDLQRYLRDVADHATIAAERVAGFRQNLTDILTVNATLVNQAQNEEVKRLTEASFQQNEEVKKISAWAAIIFAPTLIGTIYGMNFDMPELHWEYGYPFALVLMVLTSVGLWVIFSARDWL